MCKLGARPDPYQTGLHRRTRCGHVDAELLDGATKKKRVTHRLSGHHQYQQLRVVRKTSEALGVAGFELPHERSAIGQAKSACEAGRASRACELEKSERVAVTLEHQLVADRGIEWPVEIVEQQRACVRFGEPVDMQLW